MSLEESSSTAERRLRAIQGHLISAADGLNLRQIHKNETAGEFVHGNLFFDLFCYFFFVVHCKKNLNLFIYAVEVCLLVSSGGGGCS